MSTIEDMTTLNVTNPREQGPEVLDAATTLAAI
jgi:hypothetical protein